MYINWDLKNAEDDAAAALGAKDRWEQVIAVSLMAAVAGLLLAAHVHGGFAVVAVFGFMFALIGAVNWEDQRTEYLKAQAKIRRLLPCLTTES